MFRFKKIQSFCNYISCHRRCLSIKICLFFICYLYFFTNIYRQNNNFNRYPQIAIINRTIDIPFYHINLQTGIYLKKYNFHYCRVDKTMSTVMQVSLKNYFHTFYA
jgi:hypothetical protein